jgi:hypothetical protein
VRYDNNIYFANLPDDQLCAAVIDRANDYQNYIKRAGWLSLWRRAYNAYFQSVRSGGQIGTTGNQNEYKNLNVNHYRSVLTTIKGMITQQRIAYDAIASNTDVKSQAQAILANGLLQYYSKEKDLEAFNDQALEYALVMSEGWVSNTWNVKEGKVYAYHPDTNAEINEGDLEIKTYLPSQVIRDIHKLKGSDNVWLMTCELVNKWGLIEEYPTYKEQILDSDYDPSKTSDSPFFATKYAYDFCDDIPIYTLYHMPTAYCPGGKLAIVLDDDTTLFSGPLPYRDIPLHRITTSETIATNFGYTLAFDLLPIQQGINLMDSIIATNQSHYGVQNIMVARGSNLSSSSIMGGLNLVEYSPVTGGNPPQALQLLQTAPETYSFRASLVGDMNLISGANSVARGDMSQLGKSMSGSAMALIQSMAIQYANSLQKSYIRTLSAQATDIIKILRDFAKVPRIAMITGIANRPYMKQFTGDDLEQINRVEVDIGSAMAQTLAGRVDLAEKYIEQGWAKSPQEYTQVLNTGRLDALMEGPQRINLQIRKENEDLMEGREAIAIVTDDHVAHIPQHASLLDSLDARLDANLVKRTTAHIMHHMQLLKETDPALLTILKQPILSQPMGPEGPMPEEQMPPGPDMQGGGMAESLNGASPMQQEAEGVNMPRMPESPLPQ